MGWALESSLYCDGDGTPNGSDTDPNDPCVDMDVTNVDLTDTTSAWYTADCDGDGTPNGMRRRIRRRRKKKANANNKKKKWAKEE